MFEASSLGRHQAHALALVLLALATVYHVEPCLSVSSIKVAVLAVELSDATHIRDVDALQDLFSSVRSYYLEASYDMHVFDFVLYGWFKLDRTTASYGRDSSLSIDDPDGDGVPDTHRLIQDAVDLADSQVDFNRFEYLVVVHSGSGQECTGNSEDVWSCAYLFGVWFRTKEKSFGKAALVPETQVRGGNPIGVIVHEIGHLLGLPDLYSSNEQVGPWDIMGRGTWLGYPAGAIPALFCAWSRMKLGWLNGSQVHVFAGSLNIIELAPIAPKGKGIKAIKIPLSEEGSYYLVELRVKTGFDSALPQSGILVTRIRPNAPYVTVVRCADRPLEQALWAPGCVFTDASDGISMAFNMLRGGQVEVLVSKGAAPPLFSSPI